MRVNVYAEEMTDRIEIITKRTPDGEFTGIRFYLELPVTVKAVEAGSPFEDSRSPPKHHQIKGPFMHHPGDDDSSAITFWGKNDLRELLHQAQKLLTEHYANRGISGRATTPISKEAASGANKACRPPESTQIR